MVTVSSLSLELQVAPGRHALKYTGRVRNSCGSVWHLCVQNLGFKTKRPAQPAATSCHRGTLANVPNLSPLFPQRYPPPPPPPPAPRGTKNPEAKAVLLTGG